MKGLFLIPLLALGLSSCAGMKLESDPVYSDLCQGLNNCTVILEKNYTIENLEKIVQEFDQKMAFGEDKQHLVGECKKDESCLIVVFPKETSESK